MSLAMSPACLRPGIPWRFFDVDPSLLVLEIVLGNDFIWNDGERELHVFEPYHGSKVIKKLRSKVMKQAPGVEMVLLKITLIVVMLAVLVDVGPG